MEMALVKREPSADRLDANIARLEQQLKQALREQNCSIEQNMAISGQMLRNGVNFAPQATINVSGISPEFLAYVLKMAYDLWREDFERGLDNAVGSTLNLAAVERSTIIAALDQVGWRQDMAAPLLGVTRRVVYHKIMHHGITHPKWRRNRTKELTEAT